MSETFITPREYRQSEDYNFDHFIKLQPTGGQFGTISVDYESIEIFAYDYAKQYHRQALQEVLEEINNGIKIYQLNNQEDILKYIKQIIQSKLKDDE